MKARLRSKNNKCRRVLLVGIFFHISEGGFFCNRSYSTCTENITLAEAAEKLGFMSKADAEKALDPKKMISAFDSPRI